MPADHPVRKLPRKWWEWDYIAGCAEAVGCLSADATALGLGVGDEPLIFYFANYCGKVIATDLYGADTAWKHARFDHASRVLDTSPIPYPRERVEVRNVDMRDTGIADRSVDLVWSCSSIEHVPTLIDLFRVFAEIDRVLKVGGHAIITTEFCITGNPYILPGVNAWNHEIFEAIVGSLPGYTWLGARDFSFNALHPGNAARPRRYLPTSYLPASSELMFSFRRGDTLARPVGLSVIVPFGFVIRKTSEDGVVPFEEAAIQDRLKTFSTGLQAFFAGRNDEAVSTLEGVYREAVDDIQLRHFAFRWLIDARARRGEMRSAGQFADRIEEFLQILPSSPVQDADCLDICGYLVGECGRYEQALAVYRRCLLSPSTSRDHVLELCVRYLELAARGKVGDEPQEVVAAVVADLVQYGMTRSELEATFMRPALARLPAKTVVQVRERVEKRVSFAIDALRVRES